MWSNTVKVVVTLLAVSAVIASIAQARTIFIVHYEGKTSQVYKGKPSPSVAIDVDRTNRAVHFFGIAYRCPKTGNTWTTKVSLAVKHGKIDKKGNFKYTVPAGKSRLSWISGHVTSAKVTGSFAALQRGCNARGTYKATLGGK